jgi:hypothetical protein
MTNDRMTEKEFKKLQEFKERAGSAGVTEYGSNAAIDLSPFTNHLSLKE